MNVFESFLDSREELPDWRPVNLPPEERLNRFDKWLTAKLAEILDWSWAGDAVAQGRRLHQARVYVERVVMDLWRRGWLLDGHRLAARIIDPLQRIAKYQKANAIREFWPYFCGMIDRYVGANAEEIQAEARSVGATVGQIMGDIRAALAPKGPTLPELLVRRIGEVAEAKEQTLREQLAALRRREALEREEERQLKLF